MALTEDEIILIDEQIDAYCRTIKKIRQQILELERKKIPENLCPLCPFKFDMLKNNEK